VCARDQEVRCEEMDPRKSLKQKEMENDIKLNNRIIAFLKKNQSKQILYKGTQMQSEVKGVEEKQIHLERFDGLRIASQAIPVSRESEGHCCSAKKEKNCSPAAKIRSQVKKA
jgi:hypothetical protein